LKDTKMPDGSSAKTVRLTGPSRWPLEDDPVVELYLWDEDPVEIELIRPGVSYEDRKRTEYRVGGAAYLVLPDGRKKSLGGISASGIEQAKPSAMRRDADRETRRAKRKAMDLAYKRAARGLDGKVFARGATLKQLPESLAESEIASPYDDMARSLNSLAKYNDGFWKSEKQARYLLGALRNFQDPGLVEWGRANGFDPDEHVFMGWSSLIAAFGRKTADKRRYTYRGFIVDGYGLKARLTAKAVAGRFSDQADDSPGEGTPRMETARITWTRDKATGTIYEEPTGREAKRREREQRNKSLPLINAIISLLDGPEKYNTFLAAMHDKLVVGEDPKGFSVRMKDVLNQILSKHGVQALGFGAAALSDDADDWQKALDFFVKRLKGVYRLKVAPKVKRWGKENFPDVKTDFGSAPWSKLLDSLVREKKIKARTTYVPTMWDPPAGSDSHQRFVFDDEMSRALYNETNVRIPFVMGSRTNGDQSALNIVVEVRYAIQQAKRGKKLPRATAGAVKYLLTVVRKMGMAESLESEGDQLGTLGDAGQSSLDDLSRRARGLAKDATSLAKKARRSRGRAPGKGVLHDTAKPSGTLVVQEEVPTTAVVSGYHLKRWAKGTRPAHNVVAAQLPNGDIWYADGITFHVVLLMALEASGIATPRETDDAKHLFINRYGKLSEARRTQPASNCGLTIDSSKRRLR
jgi:hypothetical protein